MMRLRSFFLLVFFAATAAVTGANIAQAQNTAHASLSPEQIRQQIGELDAGIQQTQADIKEAAREQKTTRNNLRDFNSERLKQDIALKQLAREQSKTVAMAADLSAPETQTKLNQLAYKQKVAQIELDNTEKRLRLLNGQQAALKERQIALNTNLQGLEREKRQLAQAQQKQRSQQKAVEQQRRDAQKLAQQRAATTKAEAIRQQALRESNKRVLQQQLQEKQSAQYDRAREQEKARLAAKRAAKEQARKQQLTMAEQTFKDKEADLVAANAHLPPAQAALNIANAWAAEPMAGDARYGDQLTLMVSNPVGERAKTATVLKHLGNNQYTGRMRVKKGHQEFIVGDHKYGKRIARHFNNLECVVVVDARGEEPQFKLLVAPD